MEQGLKTLIKCALTVILIIFAQSGIKAQKDDEFYENPIPNKFTKYKLDELTYKNFSFASVEITTGTILYLPAKWNLPPIPQFNVVWHLTCPTRKAQIFIVISKQVEEISAEEYKKASEKLNPKQFFLNYPYSGSLAGLNLLKHGWTKYKKGKQEIQAYYRKYMTVEMGSIFIIYGVNFVYANRRYEFFLQSLEDNFPFTHRDLEFIIDKLVIKELSTEDFNELIKEAARYQPVELPDVAPPPSEPVASFIGIFQLFTIGLNFKPAWIEFSNDQKYYFAIDEGKKQVGVLSANDLRLVQDIRLQKYTPIRCLQVKNQLVVLSKSPAALIIIDIGKFVVNKELPLQIEAPSYILYGQKDPRNLIYVIGTGAIIEISADDFLVRNRVPFPEALKPFTERPYIATISGTGEYMYLLFPAKEGTDLYIFNLTQKQGSFYQHRNITVLFTDPSGKYVYTDQGVFSPDLQKKLHDIKISKWTDFDRLRPMLHTLKISSDTMSLVSFNLNDMKVASEMKLDAFDLKPDYIADGKMFFNASERKVLIPLGQGENIPGLQAYAYIPVDAKVLSKESVFHIGVSNNESYLYWISPTKYEVVVYSLRSGKTTKFTFESEPKSMAEKSNTLYVVLSEGNQIHTINLETMKKGQVIDLAGTLVNMISSNRADIYVHVQRSDKFTPGIYKWLGDFSKIIDVSPDYRFYVMLGEKKVIVDDSVIWSKEGEQWNSKQLTVYDKGTFIDLKGRYVLVGGVMHNPDFKQTIASYPDAKVFPSTSGDKYVVVKDNRPKQRVVFTVYSYPQNRVMQLELPITLLAKDMISEAIYLDIRGHPGVIVGLKDALIFIPEKCFQPIK